jgi:hypothetical protein
VLVVVVLFVVALAVVAFIVVALVVKMLRLSKVIFVAVEISGMMIVSIFSIAASFSAGQTTAVAVTSAAASLLTAIDSGVVVKTAMAADNNSFWIRISGPPSVQQNS